MGGNSNNGNPPGIYNFNHMPKYNMSSGIAGGIGQLSGYNTNNPAGGTMN